MAVKAYLFTQEECDRCELARKMVGKYLKSGEIVEMSIHDGLRRFNLGEPGGTPFIGIIAESTGECISQAFFPPEGADIELDESDESTTTEP